MEFDTEGSAVAEQGGLSIENFNYQHEKNFVQKQKIKNQYKKFKTKGL